MLLITLLGVGFFIKVNPTFLNVKIDEYLSEDITRDPSIDKVNAQYTSENPLRVLLVGDSMAMILGYSLTNDFIESHSIEFTIDAKAATSISLPEFFNWKDKLEKLLSENTYDVILIQIGANDAQGIRFEGNYHKFGSEKWIEIYKNRLREFMKIANRNLGKVYWIGLPPMINRYYHSDTTILNEIAIRLCYEENITFISTIPSLGDDKEKFTRIKNYNGYPVVIRHEDGIHFNRNGAKLIREEILEILMTDFSLNTNRLESSIE